MDAKQARKLPHLNFSPQEWFFSTRFHSLAARGLLIDLASIQWMRGGFPNDRAAIERLVGAPIDVAVWDEITPLIVSVAGGFGLRWIEDERSAAIARIERAAESGSKGAKTRYAKGGYGHPMGTPQAPHSKVSSNPIAILDCTGLERTELNRTEPKTVLAPTDAAPRRQSKPKDTMGWTIEDGWQGITEPDRAAWRVAYPACDINRQLAAADQWLRANPTKAHKALWRKFVTGWLARAQERGGDAKSNTNPIDRQAAAQDAWDRGTEALRRNR